MSVIALFDHEECGSESLTGAASPVMGEALQRISNPNPDPSPNPNPNLLDLLEEVPNAHGEAILP